MRNVFDQYSQPENRLTHALLSSLAADRRLLKRFIRWSMPDEPKLRNLTVLEQSLPGDPISLSESETERRGLPDGCITDGTTWALLIESKIAARVSGDQIRRHIRTAARRGLTDARVLLLSLDTQEGRLPAGARSRRWSDVYLWLQRASRSSAWARRCAEYFEVAETHGIEDEYLKEGTLTVFSGIPFGPDEPYSYLQGKRILGLLRDELVKNARLRRELGIDWKGRGRPAITGRGADSVWDYISLAANRRGDLFTRHPHLTLGVRAERLEAYVTIPNGVPASRRAALLGRKFSEFETRIGKIARAFNAVTSRTSGAKPMIVLVQRHYPSQRSPAVVDALLRFDPRTAFKGSIRGDRKVRFQPNWLKAVHDTLWERRSNLQLQVGVDFPYANCPAVRSRRIVESIVQVWLACRPILPVRP